MQQKARLLMLFGFSFSLAALQFARCTGFLVGSTIPQNTTIEITRLVHFTHIRNHGGVFGMLQGSGWLFALISALLLVVVTVYLSLGQHLHRYEYVCFGFIVGGGASNVLDRFIYGSVIDFIDIQHIPYWNYVFNTADVMVHVGIWPMLLLGVFTADRRQPGATG